MIDLFNAAFNPIDFQFTQPLNFAREDVGNFTFCIQLASDGFLPRDVEVIIVTQDGNATG